MVLLRGQRKNNGVTVVLLSSEEVTLSVEQLLVFASEYIGRKVEKDFDGEKYAGEVKECYPLEDGGRVKAMYVVQYEDDDIDDVGDLPANLRV